MVSPPTPALKILALLRERSTPVVLKRSSMEEPKRRVVYWEGVAVVRSGRCVVMVVSWERVLDFACLVVRDARSVSERVEGGEFNILRGLFLKEFKMV